MGVIVAILKINDVMLPDIVLQATKMTLLGGGNLPKGQLARALALAPLLIAADGGADVALAAGLMPEAVIGDMDSLSQAGRQRLGADRIFEITEQETSDFDKCLRLVPAPLVLGLGLMGARLDHQLAALHTLVRYRDRAVVLVGECDLVFHAPPSFGITLEAGMRLSLFPMTKVSGRSSGLRWPIDGIDFAPGGRIGVSNAAEGGPVHLNFDRPGMLIVLPMALLEEVIVRLERTAACWTD